MARWSHFLRRTWGRYTLCLSRRPLLTKTSTGAVILFTSDSITQIVTTSGDPHHWNAHRALSGAGFGVASTMWLHFWWGYLERAVGSRIPTASHRLANTLAKVAIDQALAAPLYIYSYFVVTNLGPRLAAASTGGGVLPLAEYRRLWRDVTGKAAAMLGPTMVQHWSLWPAVHALNFYLVPLHQRVLVQNAVLVGWSGYLSHLNHRATLMTPTEEVAIQRHATRRRGRPVGGD